jgi:hypothetical protein
MPAILEAPIQVESTTISMPKRHRTKATPYGQNLQPTKTLILVGGHLIRHPKRTIVLENLANSHNCSCDKWGRVLIEIVKSLSFLRTPK